MCEGAAVTCGSAPVDLRRVPRVQVLQREADVKRDLYAVLPPQRGWDGVPARRLAGQAVVQRAARAQLHDQAAVRPVG
jgi:hypothetical protein